MEQSSRKKRRRHMDHLREYEYAKTAEGAVPLTAPMTIGRHSRDPNRGLYPGTKRRKPLRQTSGIGDMANGQSLNASGYQRCGGQSVEPSQYPTFQSARCTYEQNLECASASSSNNSVTKSSVTTIDFSSRDNSFYLRRSHRLRRIKPNVQQNTLHRYLQCSKQTYSIQHNDLSKSQSVSCSFKHDLNERMIPDFLVKSTGENACRNANQPDAEMQESSPEPDFSCRLYADQFNDTFELFGTPSEDLTRRVSYIESLPYEILENIFCYLPMLDLCLSATGVSRQWREIISHEKFMPWKKKYHKMTLVSDKEATDEVEKIIITHGMENPSEFLFGLIRYMRTFSLLSRGNVHQSLSHHAKYSCAVEFIIERMQDCIVDGIVHEGCLIAAMCIIAHSVQEISAILDCLLSCDCPAKYVLDCIYCIATFLFIFKLKGHSAIGMHYRLYHAIFLLENDSKVCVKDVSHLSTINSGQQSILRYGADDCPVKLSSEQLRIVNHKMSPMDTVKIVAFAGTGKTTTLVQFAKLRPNMKFLHVSFNKSVSDYARNWFPPNVECRTVHSIAYKAIGHRFSSKFSYKLVPLQVMEYVQFPGNKMMGAGYALRTLTNFMNSSDDVITINHVPNPLSTSTNAAEEFNFNARQFVAEDAQRIWEKMTDPLDSSIKIVHDTYLKLFQLTKPKLEGYDCILVDEAQDCNAAMIDIIQMQKSCKILVGDPHQQIYGFRGAVDTLDKMDVNCTYYLTQSFRFGAKIGYVATCALDFLKGVKNKCLVGTNKIDGYDGQVEGQEAIIARSNHALFCEVVKTCLATPTIQAAFAGGLQSYNYDQILDIYNLSLQSPDNEADVAAIKDKFIGRFKSFASLNAYATAVEDQDLLSKIKIVKTYGAHIPEYLKLIKSRCQFNISTAAVVFSTAHKAKGLEFETVKLADDFLPFGFNFFPGEDCVRFRRFLASNYPDDEANILYVAITRAKQRLVLSTAVHFMMLAANENFETLVPYNNLQLNVNGEIDACCLVCEKWNHVPASALMLMREAVQLKKYFVPGGPICCLCSSKLTYALDELVYNVTAFPKLYNKTRIMLKSFLGPIGAEIKKLLHEPEELDNNERFMFLPLNGGAMPIHVI